MHAVPAHLRETVGRTDEGAAWLESLPATVADLAERWGLALAPPFDAEASCSWVAACTTAAGEPAVLKIGYPHMEARDEMAGLRFWDGDPTVLLLRADAPRNAMLLEACRPGTPLRTRPEEEQDEVIADLLRRLWRRPAGAHPFRPLARMLAHWSEGVRAQAHRWVDEALVREALGALVELAGAGADDVLLATDLHAGNVLRARRRPWLGIDPKPFLGDPCYDGTQHLLNCMERMQAAPAETVERMAALLGVDPRRLRDWAFARFAVHGGGANAATAAVARRLAR